MMTISLLPTKIGLSVILCNYLKSKLIKVGFCATSLYHLNTKQAS